VILIRPSKFVVESGDYILHTTLSASTKIEAIKKMHEEESEQVLTDKMNLCYVAFTRPELRLYAFNYFKDKNFGIILHQGLIQIDHQQNEDGSITVSKGTLTNKEHDQKKSSQFFEPLNVSDRLWFPDIAFTKKTDLTEPTGLSDEQRFGSQFHLLMAELNSAEELDVKLDSLLLEGSVDVQFKDMLKERIEDVFKDPAYNQLFTDALDYMNEQGIIIDEENSKRPDKVILKKDQTIILDYKTGIQKPSDFKQMKEYIQLLQEMSFPDVSGYLYYTSNNELIPIT
jgi:ATP-dependent exoDNAse (exonuclease V) beta subunit